MPLPQKRWFRVAEVAKRWAMPLSDIEDYALDDVLQLAVFVVDIPAEAGTWETGGDGGDTRALQDIPILNGPQPLLRASLAEIFREGQAGVSAFRTAQPSNYLHVRAGAPAVIVRRDDLIVTREERDRFERDHAMATGTSESVATDIWHSDDFTRVRVANEWHSFGPKQAAVLRLLKAASESDNPWLDGKRLLDEANAATMRLIDLFKRKPAWRQLVLADGKGRYRLNRDLLSPERGRVRFYRTFARLGSRSRAAPSSSR
jgi:hypothetical protein